MAEDTISRRKALTAIADLYVLEMTGERESTFNDIFEAIKDLPSIDAVQVVRCKDCRYSDDYYNDGCCYCKYSEHEMRYIGTDWNWYCADGERKEDE